MAAKATLRQRFSYWYDNFMARGGASMFLTLFLFFSACLIAFGVAIALIKPDSSAEAPVGIWSSLWWTFLHLSDPGSIANETAMSVGLKVFSVASGLIGVVIFSVLIAFITTAFEAKLEDLKKGRSLVLENDHTLILGFNDRVVNIIEELVIANESRRDACIVILADRDKEEMDDFLRDRVGELKTTRLVTRKGAPSSIADLAKVPVDQARSVIVLPDCSPNAPADQKVVSDTKVLKTILAVTRRPDRRAEPFQIVTELFDQGNIEIVRSIAPGEVFIVNTNEIIGKILVQTSRCNGLAFVYNGMFGFEGSEMYLVPTPERVTFREAMYRFADGAALGARHQGGGILINPPGDEVLEVGDEILVLAEDDSTAIWGPPVMTPAPVTLSPAHEVAAPRPERHLILGWNSKAESIVREYDDYVAPGTEVAVVVKDPDDAMRARVEELAASLKNIRVQLFAKNRLARADLLAVEPFTYQNIIILANESEDVTAENSDSETIFTLLLLRSIQRPGGANVNLITEILDHRNRELIAIAKVNDFVISNHLLSKLIAQISENGHLLEAYDRLFEAEGSEIYLKPVEYYLSELPATLRFGDVMALAQQRQEAAIGYRDMAAGEDEGANFGIVLNPDKTKPVTLKAGDQLVVVAENEY